MENRRLARTVPRGGLPADSAERPSSAWRAHYPDQRRTAGSERPWSAYKNFFPPRAPSPPTHSSPEHWVNPQQAALDKRRAAALELARRQREAASNITRAHMHTEVRQRAPLKPPRSAPSGERGRQRPVRSAGAAHLLAEKHAAAQSRSWWTPLEEKPAVRAADDFVRSDLGAWFVPGSVPEDEAEPEGVDTRARREGMQIWWPL